MLKTWSFWKTFFTAYIALVAGIWGFVEAYTYFENDILKQLLGSSWWIYYYVIPLFIATLVAVTRHSNETGQAENLDQHNRRVMLNHVENFWVKGILEKSLYGAALLELGIKEDPTAINYPWAIKRQPTNEIYPAGKSMLEIFEEIGAGRSLLILGAPGSGKSTMLFELARQLIAQARSDETEPVPVVFNLASWTEKQSVADWLADQLKFVYYVPKKTASKWVSENKMLLLLDGLDEVKQENRTKCVEVINQFRNEQGLTYLVVCSRSEEYYAIDSKLSLEGAISLQPLTSIQVKEYFDKFGKSLTGVNKLLKKDKTLQELAETPLMLSIMAMAYKDAKLEELLESNSKEAQRKHLFDTYINRMFERSAHSTSYSFTKLQTLNCLCWLAQKMFEHNLITYQIEAMQLSWLEDKNQRRFYEWIVGPIVGLISGVIVGIIAALVYGWVGGLNRGLFAGLFFGPIIGVIAMLIARESREIKMVPRIRWSWTRARFGLINGFIIGLIAGLIVVAILESNGIPANRLLIGLFFMMLAGSVSMFGFGLIEEQMEETTHPGHHLRQSIFISFFVVIFTSLLSGPIIGLIFGQLGVPFPSIFGLLLGLFGGLLLGSNKGGVDLIQHYALRLVLIQHSLLPRHLIDFLEHAVDLIFLRRVGGGYIFVHRLLMEHFAKMEVGKQ